MLYIFVLEGDRFMHRKMTEQEIISSFDEAITNGQIYLVYQPKYNHSTGRLIGAEALMRWRHPELGEQLPDDFIPIMENYGLIHRADLFAFEEICRFHNSCPNYMLPISFNISRHDLFGHDYVNEIEAIRRRYDVPVHYFRAEITESSAIGGFDLISNAVKQFHEKGYLVEMDDFGSGYSSLSILKNLPVDFLKLD
ncbi:MAG: EAL domain-containing protein, partial [Acidaminococcaceae bacterium]|nr:EAL domain-containing protein [Acidaminococcaceae bacterium]